jgi:ribonuclease HII
LKITVDNSPIAPSEMADKEMSAISLSPTFDIERDLLKSGYSAIAGVDEAGRGALAGPLAVGMVIYEKSMILSAGEMLAEINDSKKMSPRKRERLRNWIHRNSLLSSVMLVNHRVIDDHNINGATRIAIERLLDRVNVPPDIIIMDGNFDFSVGIPFKPVLKGDSRSISIASASILAKVARDDVLDRLDLLYPDYGFGMNKGYGTRSHRESIYRQGFSSVHRKSYNPVKALISEKDRGQ